MTPDPVNPFNDPGRGRTRRAREITNQLRDLGAEQRAFHERLKKEGKLSAADGRPDSHAMDASDRAFQMDLDAKRERLDSAYRKEMLHLAGGADAGRVLARGERMADAVGGPAVNLSTGQLVRGLGIGDWGGVPNDVKAMVLSGGAGAAVPGAITAGIVDLAREQSIVFGAGARVMPIESPSAKVARLTSEPAAEWKPESADRDLTDGGFAFDSADLAAASAWLYTTLTIEAVEDVVNLSETVDSSFAAQLALLFDQAGFAGDGVDKPVGLVNMGTAEDRIIERNAVGEIADYRPFVRAMGAVKAAHHEPSSVILTPDLWTELNCLQDGDDNPLQTPRAYQQLSEYVSGFLPSDGGVGSNEHTAVVGDLSAMVFGVRTDATIEVNRLGAGFKKGAVEVRAYIRFGMYLERPSAIAVMRGITLPAA